MREPRLYDTVKEKGGYAYRIISIEGNTIRMKRTDIKGGRPKTVAISDLDGDRFRLLDIAPVHCSKVEKTLEEIDAPDQNRRGGTSFEVRRWYLVRIDRLLQMISSFDSDEVILATADLCMKILKDGIQAEFGGEEDDEID